MAIETSELNQLPPFPGSNDELSPTHNVVGPLVVISGKASTESGVEGKDVHPVVEFV